MKVIPAIDIIEGKVVRLTKGDFDKRIEYLGSPLDYAIKYEEFGFTNLHVVDLMASVNGEVSVLKLIEEIKVKTRLMLQFGGGIKTLETAKSLLNCGVDKLIIGSISVTDKPEFEKVITEIPEDRIIIAVDVKDNKIAVKGWKEISRINIEEHIEYCINKKLFSFLCTDISKDGMLNGTNIYLYEKLIKKYQNINLIASGGVSEFEDLIRLENINVPAVVVGKAIYENKISLEELKRFA